MSLLDFIFRSNLSSDDRAKLGRCKQILRKGEFRDGDLQAIEELSRVRNPKSVEVLLSMLRHKGLMADPRVYFRVRVITALGELGDRRALHPLIDSLQLGELRGQSGGDPILAAARSILGGAHYAVVNAAIGALGKLGDPLAIEPLQEIVRLRPFEGNPNIGTAKNEKPWLLAEQALRTLIG